MNAEKKRMSEQDIDQLLESIKIMVEQAESKEEVLEKLERLKEA